MIHVSIETGGADVVSRAAEAAVPDFWAYFYARHPKFALGRDDLSKGPIGFLHAFMVYEAMAEAITAYARSGVPMSATSRDARSGFTGKLPDLSALA